jgi:RNA polymerase sigma-70 factor (ECF subfamily)
LLNERQAKGAVQLQDLPTQPGAPNDTFIRSIYNKYAGPLLGVAMKLTGGDRHWAEDVVQETLLRAWRHADVLLANDESRSLMPWLATVARRIVINDWRGRGARHKDIDDAALTMPAVADDTERALHRLIVLGALARLTPAHRRVVVERYLHGRSIAEIAQMVGIPPGTVKSRMHYALRVMRAALNSRGVAP